MASFCPQCGATLQPNARFCEECGASVGGPTAKPVSHSTPRAESRIWLWIVVGGGAVLLIAGGLLVALQGWVDPDKRANQLFVEASQLVQAAQKAEQESYGEAYKLYQAALAKVETILARYSASQVAVRIIEGEAKLEPYTVTELEETIIPRARESVEAEEDPLMCALQVANTIAEAGQKAGALRVIAIAYAKAGHDEQAVQVARLIEDANVKAAVLASIAAGVYAQEGRRQEGKPRKVLHAILSAADLPSSPGERGGVTPAEAILDKWQNISGKETIEFFKDGSVNLLSDNHPPMGGDYKIIDDSHVRMSLGGFAGLAGSTVWKFSVARDQLTLTLPDGTVARYRRTK